MPFRGKCLTFTYFLIKRYQYINSQDDLRDYHYLLSSRVLIENKSIEISGDKMLSFLLFIIAHLLFYL